MSSLSDCVAPIERGRTDTTSLLKWNIGQKWPEMPFKPLWPLPYAIFLALKAQGAGKRPRTRQRRGPAPALGGGGGTRSLAKERGARPGGPGPPWGRTGAQHGTGRARAVASRALEGAARGNGAGAIGQPPRAPGKSPGLESWGRLPRRRRARARRARLAPSGGHKGAGRP